VNKSQNTSEATSVYAVLSVRETMWNTTRCAKSVAQVHVTVGNESVPKIVINDTVKFLS